MMTSKFSTLFSIGASVVTNHYCRDRFHPLGAAFFSNASYPETIKFLNQTNVTIEPFALAGAREMFRYNYTNGLIEANPAVAPQFLATVSAEIPRYIQLWNQRFLPISAPNYKVRMLWCEVIQNQLANVEVARRTGRVHRIGSAMVPTKQLHSSSDTTCKSCSFIRLWRHQHRTSG